ncbi:hypothetical protein F5884DRAFT_38946 [Xylogone sp. PMI_703]|nr:hypothetical protein F5884DRAFT_38946 [Xylogone sp. PMI_703]
MSKSPAASASHNPRRPSSTSKTGRRQYRSCDQCRRGKRACDVDLPDDFTPGAASSAPLDPCSSCAKTNKTCTIEWLTTTSQALQQGRKQRPSTTKRDAARPPGGLADWGQVGRASTSDLDVTLANNPNFHAQLGPMPDLWNLYSGDGSQQQLDTPESVNGFLLPEEISQEYAQFGSAANLAWDAENLQSNVHNSNYNALDFMGEPPNYVITPPTDYATSSTDMTMTTLDKDASRDALLHRARKKRRQRSLTPEPSESNGLYEPINPRKRLLYREGAYSPPLTDPSSAALEFRLAMSHAKFSISSGLFRIYHDSMENALSCWLTERTCPYVVEKSLVPSVKQRSVDPMAKEWGSDWTNRICERVCNLDKAASSLRSRPLMRSEEKAADVALRKAIMAFATQWAHSSSRSVAEFSEDPPIPGLARNSWDSPSEFDRSMQEMFWREARDALHDAAEIESFRVIFAHIIFALTQKPLDIEEKFRELSLGQRRSARSSEHDIFRERSSSYHSSAGNSNQTPGCDSDTNDADENALLDQILELAGPPVFLETALRQMFAFRRKLEKLETKGKSKIKKDGFHGKSEDSSKSDPLSPENHQTFNLLFWLGIMFDTLSAAFNMRPLVVSDEDSDIYKTTALDKDASSIQLAVHRMQDNAIQITYPKTKDSLLWDDFLLKKKEKNAAQDQYIARWPCNYNTAATTLCDAAPIKVLLFRRITRIQTLLSRRVQGQSLEDAINDALSVHNYWNTYYGPFMSDCILRHEDLPPRVQSWYIVLCGHWHLAEFLLADTIEGIDEEELGVESERLKRKQTCLVDNLRRQNAYTMSDLGRASCPRTSESFPRAREYHVALNKGALLTEPWTEVLVRSFCKAGSVLVNFLPSSLVRNDLEEIKARCNHCIEALWYLGKKSDIALLAYKVLSDTLERKVDALAPKEAFEHQRGGSHKGYGEPNVGPSHFNISNDFIFDDTTTAYLGATGGEDLMWER